MTLYMCKVCKTRMLGSLFGTNEKTSTQYKSCIKCRERQRCLTRRKLKDTFPQYNGGCTDLEDLINLRTKFLRKKKRKESKNIEISDSFYHEYNKRKNKLIQDFKLSQQSRLEYIDIVHQ